MAQGASLMAETIKNLPAMQETWVQSVGPEDYLEKEGDGYPLQYSYLENPMDRRAWWATVHRITKSRIGLIIAFCTAHTSCLHFNQIANASKKRTIVIGLSDTWWGGCKNGVSESTWLSFKAQPRMLPSERSETSAGIRHYYPINGWESGLWIQILPEFKSFC